MILKKKINQFSFLNIVLKILNRFIQVIGSISLLIVILLTIYYFNSGMYARYKPLEALKKIDKVIFNKYLGFSLFELDDYTYQNFKSFVSCRMSCYGCRCDDTFFMGI